MAICGQLFTTCENTRYVHVVIVLSFCFMSCRCENSMCQKGECVASHIPATGGVYCSCTECYKGEKCDQPPESSFLVITDREKKTGTRLAQLNEEVTIDCLASGCPSYQWYKDDELVMGTMWNLPFYYIPEASPSDRGLYKCVASNETATDELEIVLGETFCLHGFHLIFQYTGVYEYIAQLSLESSETFPEEVDK